MGPVLIDAVQSTLLSPHATAHVTIERDYVTSVICLKTRFLQPRDASRSLTLGKQTLVITNMLLQ